MVGRGRDRISAFCERIRDRSRVGLSQQVLNPTPLKPHPCNMPQAKTEVVLQFSECCAAETALQHRLFCSAEVIWTRSCAAANEKLHCNIEKAALQESGAFLPLSCGFQAPTFRHPRFGPADFRDPIRDRNPVILPEISCTGVGFLSILDAGI